MKVRFAITLDLGYKFPGIMNSGVIQLHTKPSKQKLDAFNDVLCMAPSNAPINNSTV